VAQTSESQSSEDTQPDLTTIDGEVPGKVKVNKRQKQEFLCPYCGLTFNLKTSLVYHEKFHSPERPYPCEQCAFRFKTNAALQTHMRAHTGKLLVFLVNC